MKILYIIPRFYPFKGGAEENFLNLAERMVRKGHVVTVVTSQIKFKKDEKIKKKEIYKGIKIIRIWQPGNALYLGFYPYLLIFLVLNKNKFDVIHTSGIGFIWREICLIVFKTILKMTKRKVILVNTPHGPFMSANTQSLLRKITKNVGDKILRMYINYLYNIFIAVNNKQFEWMQSLYKISKHKICIVLNGIKSDYIEKQIINHSKEDTVTITFVGRIEWYKGVQNVINALYKLDKSLNWNFIIMGRQGGYLDEINNLIRMYDLSNRIQIILCPNDKERDNILKYESQINILPSKWEAFGISLVEAMAKGNVIITTFQNEGYDTLIKEGISGYVYDFDDIEGLSKILKEIIINYELRQKIRQHNIKFAKEFTWEKSFEIYYQIIKDQLANTKVSINKK